MPWSASNEGGKVDVQPGLPIPSPPSETTPFYGQLPGRVLTGLGQRAVHMSSCACRAIILN